jgi:bacterial leucyl aminopeptidase
VNINNVYIGGRIIEGQCGYGCSDHASWSRQGFPALMPFEANLNSMNRHIHTSADVINNQSSFRHSNMFTKIAIALALELGNSNWRE